MKTLKKVEIITDSIVLEKITSLLEKLEVGYTVIPEVFGKGSREKRFDDDVTDTFRNIMVIICCDEPTAVKISEGVEKIILDRGGIVLIYDVDMIYHG
ncbi:MAG: transcriptional regulator [Ignavibacteria bacterium]|nr:transcriptional regulator [Ignavibacteria bacterium]